jgi:hypothetical protein
VIGKLGARTTMLYDEIDESETLNATSTLDENEEMLE